LTNQSSDNFVYFFRITLPKLNLNIKSYLTNTFRELKELTCCLTFGPIQPASPMATRLCWLVLPPTTTSIVEYDPETEDWIVWASELSESRRYIRAMMVDNTSFPECNQPVYERVEKKYAFVSKR
jgi:hypothetical protein